MSYNMSYKAYFQRYLPRVEAAIRSRLVPPDQRLDNHYAMMAYHLGWRDEHLRPAETKAGKRVRPFLCLLACEAVGGDADDALPAAAGIELLHNFSLIHDDIEDKSPTRRGRPAVWHLWGIAQAINVGDAMLSLARRALDDLSLRHPPERVLQAIRLFDETCLRLTEGQYLDMRFEDSLDVSVEDYLFMIGGKTAALIATSTAMGALLGGASAGVQDAYAAFGHYLGLAFQIVDDILGVWGKEEKVGKSIASDILMKKKTYPVLYGFRHPNVGPTLRRLYAGPPFTERDISTVVALLTEAGAREAASSLATTYHHQALEALRRTRLDTPAHRALEAFAHDLLQREA